MHLIRYRVSHLLCLSNLIMGDDIISENDPRSCGFPSWISPEGTRHACWPKWSPFTCSLHHKPFHDACTTYHDHGSLLSSVRQKLYEHLNLQNNTLRVKYWSSQEFSQTMKQCHERLELWASVLDHILWRIVLGSEQFTEFVICYTKSWKRTCDQEVYGVMGSDDLLDCI